MNPVFIGNIPNKYPLYKVYMGLIVKGTIPRGFPTIFPMKFPKLVQRPTKIPGAYDLIFFFSW